MTKSLSRLGIIWAGVAWGILAGCQPTQEAKDAQESAISESASLVSPIETATPTQGENVGTVPMKGLMLTLSEDLNLRERPETGSEVVVTLPRNTVLIYSGERTSQTVDIMMKGKTWSGTWVKVKSIDPSGIGWLFDGTLKGKNQLESLTDADFMEVSEKKNRILAPIPSWSAHEIAEMLELPAFEPVSDGYSGYYQFHRSEMDEETLDGKFWLCAQPTDHEKATRIVYWGSFEMGKKVSVNADFTREGWAAHMEWKLGKNGKFEGRNYRETAGEKTTLTYEDQSEALDLSSIITD